MKKLIAVSFFLAVIIADANAQYAVINLQCEHLTSPLGMDATQPRLSWQIRGQEKMKHQTAYQLSVATDSLQLVRGNALVWNSGKINSDKQLINYSGKKLAPFTRYYWQVIAWDENGKKLSSAVSFFETGMMNIFNWKGAWISDTKDINLKPAAYFQKTFSATKKIIAARAYIAVAGLYELAVNGKKIGDHFLDPMYTRYDRRNLYVTYDITGELGKNNEIKVILGNGWYNHQPHAVWNFDQAYWRARPSFCMDLRIVYADGTVQTIATDESWKTAVGPIVFNSIYTGEQYDATKENIPDSLWNDAIVVSSPSKNIVAQAMYPIRLTDTLAAISMRKFNDTDYVFDIGRNIAGISQIKLKGEKGTVIQLKHGERLYQNDRVDQSNIIVHYRPTDNTEPFQTDIYFLKGEGTEETFRPRFNYKGFQYVEVTSNQPIQLSKESLTAYFLHSDVPVAGKIKTSSGLINKIWEATNNSYLSNLMGYPTDCPQREKNGWTGDAQIASETGLYNFDALTVYEKWMADHRDEQQPNGVLPSIVPTSVWGYEWGNGPDWTSTIAIIPWNLYLFYGDSKCLYDCYENIRRYVGHINELYPSGLCSWGLGDWVPVRSKAPKELTSTCYYFADVMILAKAAGLFHKEEDEKKYSALAAKIKAAFNAKYFDSNKNVYGSGMQTELCVPLLWGLVPGQYVAKVAAALAKRVEDEGVKLDVGLLGSKAILNALSENGYADLAYQLASSDQYPSWGYWIKNGATTLYENWVIDASRDLSLNHIMFGEISAWMYKALGGIKPDPQHPGFKNILLQPNFVKGLDSFYCYHDGPYGRIESSWKREGQTVRYDITIPPNSTATLIINNRQQQISSGTYHFVYDNK